MHKIDTTHILFGFSEVRPTKAVHMNIPEEEIDHLSGTSGWSYHLENIELEYMRLIQNQIQPLFPNFTTALSGQSPVNENLEDIQ
jgi:hypothetical protein